MGAATAFSQLGHVNTARLGRVDKPYPWRDLDDDIAQFYGGVNGVMCTTLWDPGCSHNLVTPEFADELIRRGARWSYCQPLTLEHGVGGKVVTSAAPAVKWVEGEIVLCEDGLTYRAEKVKLYVYRGALPDVMISKKQLEHMTCLEKPEKKLLKWKMTREDHDRLAHMMDAAMIQAHCCLRSGEYGLKKARSNMGRTKSVQDVLKEMCEQRERLRERVGRAVSKEAEAVINEILERYPLNFRKPGKDPCRLGTFKIQLKDHNKSFICLPRRTNPLVMEEMRRQVAEQEAAGVIERCEGDPASVYAICMARHPVKPGLRFCLDARPLNANTVLMPYAVPEINESLDRLSGYKMYSTFDLSAYFQQFDLAEESRDLVAFLVPGDDEHPPQIWRYKRLTFGLVNASFWAQRQLAEALEKFPGCESLRNFIDDICVGANTIEEMARKVTALMEFCQHYNLRLKREKCQLCVGAVKHLGFIVSEEGKSLDPARVDSLINMKAPTNIKALKSLLGSFAFVRGWLADASTTAAPLTDLLSTSAKKRGWTWGKAQDDALAQLKVLVQTAPVLAKPDYRLPFHVFVDASDVGVGAVLCQYQLDPLTGEQKLAGIAYASRRFSAREQNWPVGEKEAYGCKYGMEKFREYLVSHPDVTLHCDHLNMQHMWSCASAKIARWRLYLQQFEPLKIVHVAGKDNLVADSLSRLHLFNLALPVTPNAEDEEQQLAEAGEGGKVDGLMNCTWAQVMSEMNTQFIKINDAHGLRRRGRGGEEDRDPPFVARTPDELALETLLAGAIELSADKSVVEAEQKAEVVKQRAEDTPLSSAAEQRASAEQRAAQWSETDHRDARLLARCKFPNKRVIGLAHDETHPSFATTWARVQRAHGFPPGDSGAKLKAEVKSYCDTCLICAKLKPAREKLEARTGSIRQRPFTQYAFDLIVLSEPDSRGFKYIFAIIDTFSGAVELFPLRKAAVMDVAECLHDVLQRWTRPHSVRCDNAKSFAAAAVKEMLKLARIKQHFVAPYSHVSNGQIENANRRIEYLLRAMILDQRLGPSSKLNWSLLVPAVRGVINARAVGKHGCTPNDLMYGATSQRDVSIYEDEPWMVGFAVNAEASSGDASSEEARLCVHEWRRQHQCLIDKCEAVQDDLLQKLADLNGGSDDVGQLEPGDAVLLCVKGRRHHKLSAPWAGPYLIVDRPEEDEGTNVVLVQHLATKVLSRVHVRDLKRCSLDHYERVDDALPVAALDNFEYSVERILQHRPAGKRKAGKGKARAKKEYEFEVLWADLPLEDGENPSWEPWQNSSLRSCEAYKTYCLLPEVIDELGADFYAGEAEPELDESPKKKRR